jgi:hypothetical protein
VEPGRSESRRRDSLAGACDFAHTVGSDEDTECRLRYWHERRPVQHVGQRRREFLIADGVRGGGVHGTNQVPVDESPRVNVGQVVEVDPRQPLAAVTDRPPEPDLEQRSQQSQDSAAR